MIKIGNIQVNKGVFMAPMAGITDTAFRTLCKEQGADVVCTEMISAKGLYYQDKKTEQLMYMKPENRPISLQIFGSDPEIMEQVVTQRLNHLDTFDFLDINMGCPAPKIVNNGDGCALMKKPKLMGAIAEKVKKVSNKPVTVKIRLGWDQSSVNYLEAGKLLESCGVDAIILHGRTREQFYRGHSDWNAIGELKSRVTIPIIGNGDIMTGNDAKEMMESTKCDGVMVGRGALGNPWIFRDIGDKLSQHEGVYNVSNDEKMDMMLKHMRLILADKGERIAILQMRKHCGWYIKGLHGAAEFRKKFNQIRSKNELEALTETYKQFLSQHHENS
jgi:tRNA-dihydrouridine synthase B